MKPSPPSAPANPSARFRSRPLLLLLALSACLALSGCITGWDARRTHDASSVVQFLYPDKANPYVQPEIPTLRLPLRVGVAFVPSGDHAMPYGVPGSLDETEKAELLKQVGAQFRNLPFVSHLEIIPTTYLRPGGGFENLDQLRAMLGIDVAVLVAYDQAQNSRDNEWSLAYWTIVGAYTVPARKNETHTLMEAVVYDIPSRSLLFRAPGTSSVGGHSTLFRSDRELEADGHEGFKLAAADLTTHLAQELESFKVRIREQPETVHIEHRPGYTGGGELDRGFVLAAGALILLAWLTRFRK